LNTLDQVNRVIKDRGRDAHIVDWLDEITTDCPIDRHLDLRIQFGITM
jgi:hypothetical protein